MADHQLMQLPVLRALYAEYQTSLALFSGSLDDSAVRTICYGDGQAHDHFVNV